MDSLPPDVRYVLCADWSRETRGRAAYVADIPQRSVSRIGAFALTFETLLAEARRRSATGGVLVGLDLPFGLPARYFAVARTQRAFGAARDFVDWLPRACALSGFFEQSDAGKWTPARPFFSVPPGKGALTRIRQEIAAAGAGDLRRVDQLTRAKPMFVRSGIPGSVGSAVCDVWPRLGPMLADSSRDFGLWPMEGALEVIFRRHRIAVAEMYPRAAYATALTDAGSQGRAPLNIGKSRPEVRAGAVTDLLRQSWLVRHGVTIQDSSDALLSEDCFDAMLTAAALLRCALEQQPIGDLSLGDPAVEGTMLCTGTVNLALTARRLRAAVPGPARTPARTRGRRPSSSDLPLRADTGR